MKNQELLNELISILGSENVLTDEPMSKHTTFKIGGAADFFVTPETLEQVQQVVALLHNGQTPFCVIGNGSNLLVSDEGYRGVVIQLFQKYSKFEILHDDYPDAVDKQNKIYIKAQSGIMLSRLGTELANQSLAGFEFATGIPGTLGGAVRMNAGAYGGEIKDVLIRATVMDSQGNISVLSNEELQLGYRTSIVDRNQLIVLDAVIALHVSSKAQVLDRIRELQTKRREKQPLEYPSAGSTFKRPTGYFAGKLISDAGLKGVSVGGAQVSEKHAGFVINTGNATAKDVIDLTDLVRNKVADLYGVELELEVKKLGFH